MLQLLHIENIAVIERADISFRAGFNALTGETGAGKSIVIDSLGAVLGARTSRDLIRTGKMTEVIGNMKTVNDAGNKYYYFAPQMEPIKNNYKPYKIWMPVPKREREVNKNLSQNPGYTQTI